uniref:Uncharacterized protein n=1 Tax=Hemiselmis tepida TaxID=464990 RepID=A0A7S0V7U9_9CRYP|mmetsp:Transcript_14457/g.36947  ORF Transcript_14457/g.36947 Transcript_14457/m.36947 type:complete len:319 (+) Transcript_14457:103-1059(+)
MSAEAVKKSADASDSDEGCCEEWMLEEIARASSNALNASDFRMPLKVHNELFIAGQIDDSSVAEIHSQGIKSIFNLREAGEEGYTEPPQGLEASITKTHYPLPADGTWNDSSLDKLLAELDKCAKPSLVYCKTGPRAAAVAFAHLATRTRFNCGKLDGRNEFSPQAMSVLDKAVCGPDQSDCHMRSFVEEYVKKKVALADGRPGMVQLPGNVWTSGQLTEEEYKEVQKDLGIVCVLNMRPFSEAGEFGLGVLAREPEIIKELGMEYHALPVPKSGPYEPELIAKVGEMVRSLPRPLLIHCRTGRRVRDIVGNSGACDP